MRPLSNQKTLPFVAWLLLTISQAAAQTPAPATMTPFPLPLADGTSVSALILPGPNGDAWLVYTTASKIITSWRMTPTSPTPPPDPVPPVPPVPQKLTIAIVENPEHTTQQQRHVLASPDWRRAAAAKHDFLGIVPNDVIDKRTGQPPPRLAPFLDRAKLHNLPWIMFTSPTGTILWEGPVPTTATELSNLIQQYGG